MLDFYIFTRLRLLFAASPCKNLALICQCHVCCHTCLEFVSLNGAIPCEVTSHLRIYDCVLSNVPGNIIH